MNYQGVLHVPVVDIEQRCSGCDEVVTDGELVESAQRQYDEPRCNKCMTHDEVNFEAAVERQLRRAR